MPAIIYGELVAADADKNQLLLGSVETQGQLIATTLAPLVQKIDGAAMRAIAQTVQSLGTAGPNIKLLFRPASQADTQGFFYIASAPSVPAQYLEQERQSLLQAGILDRLGTSCGQEAGQATRFINPAGGQELLTSITPIKAPSGCWAVITATQTQAYLGSSLGRSYWQTPAVELAAVIYLAMAALVTILFAQAGLSLRRFGRLARDLRTGVEQRGSFASLNRVPELSWVAVEFDNLVTALRSSAQAVKLAAEEVAHAFKTPLGIIAQSLEPLRRAIPTENVRARRALELVSRSLDRLDGLVSAARRLDETIADSFNPPRDRVSLSELVSEIVGEYGEAHIPERLEFVAAIEPGLMIVGAARLLETTLQNLIDNAVSFSRVGGKIEIGLKARGDVLELSVADEGPGVEPDQIEHIFDRFFSVRPSDEVPDEPDDMAESGRQTEHFGLGLWIVRRNVEAMGGVVAAKNRPEGGLVVIAAFPRWR